MYWKRYFSHHILERGYDYYCDDVICDFKFDRDTITAVVNGTEDYDVEIRFYKDAIKSMYCSCPYAQDMNNCKHMAAVLFEWEDYKSGDSRFNSIDDKMNKAEDFDEINRLINLADEKKIKEFLSYVLKNNSSLFLRFKLLVEPKKLSNLDMNSYKERVINIIDSYLNDDEYISYYGSFDFYSELEDFFDEYIDAMVKSGLYFDAFDLSYYIFTEISKIEVDDSGGARYGIEYRYEKIWEKICDNIDEATEEKIYEKLIGNLTNLEVYYENFFEEYLMKYFNKEKFLVKKLAYLKLKLEEVKYQEYEYDYEVGKWALYYIEIMEKLNYSISDIFEFCKEYNYNSNVRIYYIYKCIERSDYEEAIRVLEESLILDENNMFLRKKYRIELKEIYKKTGNIKLYKEQLWYLIIRDDIGNLEFFNELKKQYTPEEWNSVREDIFLILKNNFNIDILYKEERCYERLLDYVLTSSSVYKLIEHESILKDIYPSETLDLYTKLLAEMSSHTSSRDTYRQWVSYLNRMLDIEGGRERVDQIVNDWKVKYKRRRALMEELKRVH